MAMNELRAEVEAAAQAELNRANERFPLFNSRHEGYAVTLEELEEAKEALDNAESSLAVLWDGVRGKKDSLFPGGRCKANGDIPPGRGCRL